MKKIEEITEEFYLNGKSAIIIGNVDTGKTTFIFGLINYLVNRGLTVGLIDGDVGQSSLGPPSTIGYSLINNTVESYGDIEVKDIYFTGSISPSNNLLPSITGLKCMFDRAISDKADKIIIDTTGMIKNYEGMILKRAKIEIIRPDFIFFFEHNDELKLILSPFKYMSFLNLRRIEVPQNVGKKSSEFRTLERKKKFLTYFNKSRTIQIDMKNVGFTGMNFTFSDKYLGPNELRYLSSLLDFPVSYGEQIGEILAIDLPHQCQLNNKEEIKEHYSVSFIDTIDPIQCLVGLISENNETIAVGIVNDFRPKNKSISIFCPSWVVREKIKRLHIGIYRLPDELYNELVCL